MTRPWLVLNLFCICIFISACSRPAGDSTEKSRVTFNFQRQLPNGSIEKILADGDGGIMVFGRSVAGSFGKPLGGVGGSVGLTLPNETWTFYGISWSGPNLFEGSVKCGKANRALTGADESVNIILNLTGCDSDFFPFDGAGGSNGIIENIVNCNDINNVTGPAVTDCDDSTAPNGKKGLAAYVRIELMDYENYPGGSGVNGGLSGPCFTVDSAAPGGLIGGSISTLSNIKIPFGGANLPFFTRIKTFYGAEGGSSCNENDGGSFFIDFPNGISQSPNLGREAVYHPTGTNSNALLFVQVDKTELCNHPSNLVNSRFGAGIGTTNPFIICTKEQWNRVATDANWGGGDNYQVKRFILGRDIEFGGVPTNFKMFGQVYGTTAAGTPYIGFLDGNNKKLKNIVIRNTCQGGANIANSHAGVIRVLGNGSVVKDLTIENILLDLNDQNNDCQKVGGLVGEINADGNAAIIDNVKVNGMISAGINTGGLVGLMDRAEISNVKVNAEVRSRASTVTNSNAGGIVGTLATDGGLSVIKKAHFDGIVDSTEGNLGAGGIIGKLSGNQNIDIQISKVEGNIRGDSRVGGFLGLSTTFTAGLAIESSYSNATLTSENTATPDLGGFIGNTTGGGYTVNIENSFVRFGTLIVDSAHTGNDYGPVVGVSAVTPTCTNVISTVNLITATGAPNSICSVTNNPSRQFLLDDSNIPGAYLSADVDANGVNDWSKSDDGFDHPRLEWEGSAENSCSGIYTTAPSSNIICTPAQFINEAANFSSYTIGTDLDFLGISPTDFADTSAFIETLNADYNGNGNRISNMHILTGQNFRAPIKEISSTGSLSNFQIVGTLVDDTGINVSNNTLLSGLVSINNGLVEKIYYLGYFLGLNSAFLTNNPQILVAPLAITNNGTIKNSVVGGGIIDTSGQTTGGSDPSKRISFGVFVNSGTLEKLEISGEYGKSSTSEDENSFPGTRISGVADTNSGIISRVKVKPKLRFIHSDQTFDGDFDYAGITLTNQPSGIVNDIQTDFDIVANFLNPSLQISYTVLTNLNSNPLDFSRIVIEQQQTSIAAIGNQGQVKYSPNTGSIAATILAVNPSAQVITNNLDGESGINIDPSATLTNDFGSSTPGVFAIDTGGVNFTGGISLWNMTNNPAFLFQDPTSDFAWEFRPDKVPELAITREQASLFFRFPAP